MKNFSVKAIILDIESVNAFENNILTAQLCFNDNLREMQEGF
jgi:hypothetical protein